MKGRINGNHCALFTVLILSNLCIDVDLFLLTKQKMIFFSHAVIRPAIDNRQQILMFFQHIV